MEATDITLGPEREPERPGGSRTVTGRPRESHSIPFSSGSPLPVRVEEVHYRSQRVRAEVVGQKDPLSRVEGRLRRSPDLGGTG